MNTNGVILLPFTEFPALDSQPEPPPHPKDPAKHRAAALSHDNLTRLGARWLRNQGYTAFREVTSIYANEVADVIGWTNAGVSCLIECKRSRADFKAEAKKECRRFDDLGFGNLRYYLCPAGLLLPADIPPKWGLVWAYENRIVMKKRGEHFDYKDAAVAEKRLLTALLARLDSDVRELSTLAGRSLPSRSE